MLHISEEQVEKALDYETAIRLAREAYVKEARGQVLSPPRALLDVPDGSSLYCMPAHALGSRSICVKLARANRGDTSLPSILATIHLFDSKTGVQIAEIEAENLTAMRTAASSALATDVLARKEASSLGVFGAGRQARAHIPAILKVRDIEKILVYSKTRDETDRFAREMSKRVHASVQPAKSPEQVAKSSDILVLATNSPTPLFDGNLVQDEIHVNAMGAALPTKREVDSVLVRRSFLVVDSREQAFSSYGDIAIPVKEHAIDKDHVKATLGELIVQPGGFSRHPGQITLFKSGGIAALDAVVSDYLVSGLGT